MSNWLAVIKGYNWTVSKVKANRKNNIKLLKVAEFNGEQYIKKIPSSETDKADKELTISEKLAEEIEDKVIEEEYIAELKKWLVRERIPLKKLKIALSCLGVITRIVTIPKMPKKEIENVFTRHIDQYFTLNIEDYIIDYRIVDSFKEKGQERLNVLLAALPKDKLEKSLHTWAQLGFKPEVIDLTSDCLTRIYSSLLEKREIPEDSPDTPALPGDVAIVDLNSDRVEFVLLQNSTFFLYSDMEAELRNLEEMILESYNNTPYGEKQEGMDDSEAEQLLEVAAGLEDFQENADDQNDQNLDEESNYVNSTDDYLDSFGLDEGGYSEAESWDNEPGNDSTDTGDGGKGSDSDLYSTDRVSAEPDSDINELFSAEGHLISADAESFTEQADDSEDLNDLEDILRDLDLLEDSIVPSDSTPEEAKRSARSWAAYEGGQQEPMEYLDLDAYLSRERIDVQEQAEDRDVSFDFIVEEENSEEVAQKVTEAEQISAQATAEETAETVAEEIDPRQESTPQDDGMRDDGKNYKQAALAIDSGEKDEDLEFILEDLFVPLSDLGDTTSVYVPDYPDRNSQANLNRQAEDNDWSQEDDSSQEVNDKLFFDSLAEVEEAFNLSHQNQMVSESLDKDSYGSDEEHEQSACYNNGIEEKISPIVDTLSELLGFFAARHFGKSVSSVYLTGELAATPHLQEILEEALGLKVIIGFPKKWQPKFSRNCSDYEKDWMKFGSLCGLALRKD